MAVTPKIDSILRAVLSRQPARTKQQPTMDEILAERYRERTRPRPGDLDYAHLADLRDALSDALAGAKGVWLDLGAGTSPYRELLPGAELRTADLAGSERYGVDYELDETGTCPVPDGTFDGVLSSQVLEHVDDPARYLAEAYRVLAPGGRLVLSTHGVWEDHGGQDLWRWTADGLAEQLRRAGFEVTRTRKLTCGPRALLLLLRRHGRANGWPGTEPLGLILKAAAGLDRLVPASFDDYLRRHFAKQGIASGPDELFYLAVLVEARRPEGSAIPASTAQAWEWSSTEEMQSYLAGVQPRADYLRDRAERAARVVETLGLDGSQRLFEIGSGEGVMAAAVAPHAAELWCTDISTSFLDKARQTCREQSNVVFRHVGRDYLDTLPDGQFDGGYCFNVFIHLGVYDIYHYLRGVARILRPGGRFVVNFADIGDATIGFFRTYAGKYRQAGAEELAGFMTWHSRELMERVAAEAGLQAVPEAFTEEDGMGILVLRKAADEESV